MRLLLNFSSDEQHVDLPWHRAAAAQAAALMMEEEVVARVEAAVRERVEAAMASEEVAKRVQARLREERARLEEKVTRQVCYAAKV